MTVAHDTAPLAPTLTLVDAPFPTVGPSDAAVDARDLIALHVAASLPEQFTLTQREQIRRNWNTYLKMTDPIDGHEAWVLGWIPGVHHGDNDTYAVHLPTGTVFGGTDPATGQHARENTDRWLTRLTTLI